MQVSANFARAICEAADLRGRVAEAFLLRCSGLDVPGIAEQMGIRRRMAYRHIQTARHIIRHAQMRHDDLREWYEFLLHEAPTQSELPSNPRSPEFYEHGGKRGERVALNSSGPVTADDLMSRAGFYQERDESRPRRPRVRVG